ncbi:MAG TPA: Cache 3/Cache 2 fusion domain-containing protein [Aromatoleum sp.]|uniref:Cache 3/Cache 2 fusion domain-containing protein n=1 Tax=Aromatoleum sp. TaxID=2307007 RepID=UPI002B459B9B|nr:Cache 3/Cache 2 fusion domain-containing protein [Aromatoleum sp.]HJV27554.1 Cache 3/Cache 2 fusion domain-containing protein [Aromatoleum sp.]
MDDSLDSSLQYKLGAIVLSVTVLALGIFGSVLLEHVERTEYREASEHLLDSSRRVRGMLAVNHQLMQVAADEHFAAFEALLDAPIRADKTTTVHVGTHHVPQLRVGRQAIGPDFAPIDEFTRDSPGSIATIFVRHGDEFLRIATSLRDQEGRRAVGTLLGSDHPAHRRLLRGEAYVGPAQLFGRPYMTKYRPVVGPGGEIIGALFVGLDLSSSFAQIREEIKAIQVGRTGYVYVLDAQPGEEHGRLLIHPGLEGQNIFDLAEPEALGFFRKALSGNGDLVDRYRFRDPNGQFRDKIAAVVEFPERQWVIASASYYDEFTAQRRRLQYAVLGALLIAATAIVIALKASIRRLVLMPLLKMHETLRASEMRFRTLVTSTDDLIYTTDETGRLTAIFDKGLVAPREEAAALVGRPIAALLGKDDALHGATHARALEGEHVVYDWWTTGPRGKIDIQSALSPMHDADGKVSGLVCIGRDITERRRAETLANHLAQHDTLTGLPNRMLMQDRLQQAIHHAERNGRLVGLLFIDLDHFKQVNDRYGHETGDQLLQAVAQRLLACVRQTDTVTRIGGDEFVVVISEAANQEALVQVAEKLLGAFAQSFQLPLCTLTMSPSIGISAYPLDAQDAVDLIKAADAAMYAAKNAGRASIRCSGTPISRT